LSTAKKITGDTKVVKNNEIISSDMDNEKVMMSIERGEYYGVNSVGSRIWELLETPVKVSDLCETLCHEYDVAPDQCNREVHSFLAEMIEKNLAIVVDE
jgi:hypothetical protein